MAHNVGPTQLPLAGLYGLLGVKDGSNPDTILGYVSPTLDALGFWLRASRVRAGGNLNGVLAVTSGLLGTAIAVPQNEWWYLHSVSALLIAAGAGSISVEVVDSASAIAITASNQVAVAAGVARSTLGGIWLAPGSTVQVRYSGTVGDAYQITMAFVSKARI